MFTFYLESNIGALQELRALDMSHNQIKDLDDLVEALRGNRELQAILVEGNPCCPNNNPESRLKVLAAWLNVYEPTRFPLRFLNGKYVCIPLYSHTIFFCLVFLLCCNVLFFIFYFYFQITLYTT